MKSYRWRDRLIQVEDGEVALIHRQGSAYPGLAKLPKRWRLQVRGQIEVVSDLGRSVDPPTKED